MYFVKIMLLLYFVIGFVPVFRFYRHKFFYYILLLALIDPFFFLFKYYFNQGNFIYLPISFSVILWSFPLFDFKFKTLISISFFISIYHNEYYNVIHLLIMDSIFVFIFLKLIECFNIEQKTDGKGGIFLIILALESILNGFIIFMFVEESLMYIKIYPYLLALNILLFGTLSLAGSKAKISIPFLKFGTKIKLFSAVKGYNYQVDIANSNLPFNPLKNNNNELTERELQVLKFIRDGMTSKEIAEKLFLSKKTIDHYRATINQKLNTTKKSEMIKFFDSNYLNLYRQISELK